MVLIPLNTDTTQYRLDQMMLDTGRRSKRLGMSQIGEECKRRIWYGFRWANPEAKLPARIKRLFGDGDRAENTVIEALLQIGITVTDRQKGFPGFAGHAYGYIDGIAHGVIESPKTPHLLEVKSMKNKLYQKLLKYGIKKTYPKHYAQCQRYMKANVLERTIYCAYNKDDSSIHVIRIKANKSFQRDALRLEMEIILAEEPPERRWENDQNYNCRFCPHIDTCWHDTGAQKNCRTCRFIDLEDDGKWSCTFGIGDVELEHEFMMKGCENYKQIEGI